MTMMQKTPFQQIMGSLRPPRKDWSKLTVNECRDELHRMYDEAMAAEPAPPPVNPPQGGNQ